MFPAAPVAHCVYEDVKTVVLILFSTFYEDTLDSSLGDLR